MKLITSSLVNESGSKIPSQATSSHSPRLSTVWLISGWAITCNSVRVAGAAFFFLGFLAAVGCSRGSFVLYGRSPIARDTANSPFTRSCATKPPAAMMRASSAGREGLWSIVMALAMPPEPTMIRESPTFPICRWYLPSLGSATQKTAVLPSLKPSFLCRNVPSMSKAICSSARSVSGSLVLLMRSLNISATCLEHRLPECPSNTPKKP
mmetsp:Transcript_38323/g.63617  ORF Transcript_38323/g.63617 Transcript_38323/m.63617 type:complete len:209 (+) Transcript_38323:1500-2126(+)